MRIQISQKAEPFAQSSRRGLLWAFALFACALALSLARPTQAAAATSSTINFQARLETAAGAIASDGNYNVEFKLYNASSSSGSSQGSCTGDAACLWAETRTGANQVRVVNGYLTVNLGSVTPFGSLNWNQQMWLTMRIGGTSGTPSWDAEMSPRLQLTAVPYAFQAGALGNGTNQAVLDSSGNLVFQQASTVKELSAATGTALTIQGGAATSGTNTGGNLLLQGGAGASTGASGSVIVKPAGTDSSTAFQVQNAAGTETVLNVDTVDKFVGIGTASPLTTLHVVSSDTALGGALIENTDNATHGGTFAPLVVQHDSNTVGDDAGVVFRLQNASSTAVPYGYIGGAIQSNTAGSQYGQLLFYVAANGFLGGLTAAPEMVLNGNGLGIGPISGNNPQYQLQVVGDTSGTAVGPVVVQSTTSGSSIGTALTLNASPAGGHSWSLLSTGPGAASGAGYFSFFDGTANAYRLTINTSGEVGIVTTNPQYTLDVTGTGRFTSSVLALVLDTASAGALTIGNTNATSIALGNTTNNIATTINGTALVKPTSGHDSTTAFQVQSASAVNLLSVNTSSLKVTIGAGATGETTPSLLVLDSQTGSAADPTEVNGALYYNVTDNSFRCSENGIWRSCLGGLVNANTSASSSISNTTTETDFSSGTNTTYTMLANDCQPGVVYTIAAQGVYATALSAPTLTFALTLDGTATNLIASGAIATVSSAANAGWRVDAQIICDTTGSSGTIDAQGEAIISSSSGPAGSTANTGLMSTNVTKTINTTTSHTLALAVTWGTANASNAITMHQFIVQRLGP